MMPRRVYLGAVASTLLITLVSFSPAGIIQAVIPQVVPTPNRQGSTGTKFFICTGAFVTGNAVTTDASGNCIDGGVAPGGGGGLIPYSSDGGLTLTAGTYFFPFGGGGAPSTTETDVQTLVEQTASLSNFAVQMSASIGGGNTAAFTVRDNAADTAITCTASAASTCNYLTPAISSTAGHRYDVKLITTGTVTVTPLVQWTLVFGAPGVVGPTGPTGPTGGSGGGSSTTAIRQSYSASSALTLAAGINVVSGDSLLVMICSDQLPSSVTDSQSNTYTDVVNVHQTAFGNNFLSMWQSAATSSGALTQTINGVTTNSTCQVSIALELASAMAFDASGSSATTNLTSLTTTHASDLIIHFGSSTNNAALFDSCLPVIIGYRIATDGSVVAGNYTAGAAGVWPGCVFLSSGSGAASITAAFN